MKKTYDKVVLAWLEKEQRVEEQRVLLQKSLASLSIYDPIYYHCV